MSTSKSVSDLTLRFSSATMFCLKLQPCERCREIYVVVNVPILCFPSKRENVPKLSEQRLVVGDGKVPFPLYTCVHVKKDVSALEYSGKNTEYVEVRLRSHCGQTSRQRSVESFFT